MFKKILKLVFFSFLILPFFLYGESSTPVTQYQKRLLGDKAFDSGLYDVAMNYYENYLKEATGDSPAIRDAYYCLIQTCLRSNNINEAKRLHNELTVKFEQYYSNHPEDQLKLKFWEAQILLADGKLNEASRIFNELLNKSTEPTDEISLNALKGEAISTLRMGNTTKARMLFLKLKDYAFNKKNSELYNMAMEEIIMIDLLNGNYKEAKLIIESESKNENANTIKLDMLNIYALTSEGNLKEARTIYNKIRPNSLGPNQLWYFVAYSLAAGYIKNSQPEAAMSIIDDAFALAPDMYDKEQTTILKINNFIKLHNYEQAISISKMFLDTFPNSNIRAKILLTLTSAMIKEKQFTRVGELADKYFPFSPSKDPDVLELAELFGKNALELKQYDNAKDFFDYVISNAKDTIYAGNAKYWKAEIAFNRKDYTSAMEQYKSIEKKFPFLKEESLFKQAQICIAQDNYIEAANILSILLTEFPDTKLEPSPLFMYAVALEKIGDYQKSIEQYVRYATTKPNAGNAGTAYYEAGSIALIIQKPDIAIEYFEKIINSYKNTIIEKDTLYKLVYTNLLIHNFDKAAKYAEQLTKNYPDADSSVQAQFWLANYYQSNRQFNEAIKKLQTIIDSNKDTLTISNAYLKQANIYYEAKNNAKALQILQILQAKYPDSNIIPDSYFLQGNIFSSIGKYSDAITSYKKASTEANNEELSMASIGRIGDCYFAALNYTQDKKQTLLNAVSSYQKILSEKNLSTFIKTQTLYKLGKSYELLEDIEKATEAYHEAFYSNIIYMEQEKNPSKIWMVKSAIALTRLLQEENTPEGAEAAIKILNELIKFNIEPISNFQQKIDEIRSLYKLKE